jgi:hypothetical protein
MRALAPILALLHLAAPACAEDPANDFYGEEYRLGFQDQARREDGRPGNAVAEFTRTGETVNDWTKLFAYYSYPDAGEDAMRMAEAVGTEVKRQNPDANYAVNQDGRNGDAIVDFITWEPDSDVLEFNIFKFAPAKFGPGLVALQYAQRIKADDTDGEKLRELRQRMILEMADEDIAQAQDYFAARTKENATSADTRGSGTSADGTAAGQSGKAAPGNGSANAPGNTP